nr:protein LTO1 homolog isoform X2 [Chlorocebus sabaeus]
MDAPSADRQAHCRSGAGRRDPRAGLHSSPAPPTAAAAHAPCAGRFGPSRVPFLPGLPRAAASGSGSCLLPSGAFVPEPPGTATASQCCRIPGAKGALLAAMAGTQDIFDSIVMADERFHGEGYREGYEEGSSLGVMEGRQHGTLHGAKIGSEIGCYQGFAFAWKCLLHSCTTEKDSRKMKVLESLIGMIQKFPYDDPTYDKLHEDLDKIRGKFKQVRALCVSSCWERLTVPFPGGAAHSRGHGGDGLGLRVPWNCP